MPDLFDFMLRRFICNFVFTDFGSRLISLINECQFGNAYVIGFVFDYFISRRPKSMPYESILPYLSTIM